MLDRIVLLKNRVKSKFDKFYYNYGLLCATHPLPMVTFSVLLVILCSLPICSLPVFERTATFLFGRITLENYQCNVSSPGFASKTQNHQLRYVQQVTFVVNVSAEKDLHGTDIWILLQQFTPIQNLTRLLQTGKDGEETNHLKDICMKITRKPFYTSPHTRLIYPKGRFHKELKKWFPREGCLITGPSTISGISERKRDELHDSFKELVFGLPFNTTGITDDIHGNTHLFYFTYTFFLDSYDGRFLSLLKSIFPWKKVGIEQHAENETFQIICYPLENSGPVELIPLTLTYLLVFLYLLFSVAKLEMLKSRWGLAFAAVMTIVLSVAMAVGICASFDAIPNTMTIKEIFPYLVIIIGLENVLIITKSVLSTPVAEDVIIRVARGMEKEGWYMTRTVVVEMLILGAGYYTKIPSLQEFCSFACIGVLSDFFLQLVFFTPVLAVDIRRAEMPDLQRRSLEEQLRHGFNLPLGFADALSKRLRVVSVWARTRIIQRGFMIGCILYISFVVYQQLNDNTVLEHGAKEDIKADVNVQSSEMPFQRPTILTSSLKGENHQEYRCLGEDERWNMSYHYSWQLLCKQHWLELFAYYHLSQKDRALVILPQIDVKMQVDMTAKDLQYVDDLADKSGAIFIKGALITTGVLVCLGTMFSLVWLCCIFCGRSRRVTKGGSRVSLPRISLAGHTHRIKTITCTSSHLISCCLHGNIRIWDPIADRCLVHLDRRRLISVDHTSNQCDPELQTEYEQHAPEVGDSRPAPNIWCLAAKSETVSIGCSNGNVEVFSMRRKKRLCTYNEEDSPVTAIKVSTRSSIVVGRKNGLLDFLEILRSRFDSLKEVHALIQPESQVTELDESEGACKCILKNRIRAHSHAISSVEATGGKILTSCVDGSFKIYDGEDRIFFLQPQGCAITSSYVSTDYQFLAFFGYEDGNLYTINLLSRGIRPRKVSRHETAVMSIRADDQYVYTLGADNIVYISQMRDYEEVSHSYKAEETIHSIEVLGQHVLVAVSENSIILVDGATGNEIEKVAACSRSPRFPSSLNVCSVDHSSIALARGRKLEIYRFPFLIDKRD